MSNLAKILVFALALWFTTLIVGGNGPHGIWVDSVEDNMVGTIFSFVIVAIIFGIINMTVGRVIKFVALPLRVITLGLFSLVINAVLIGIVSWISGLIGFGLKVESFWWAILAAIVLAVFNMILNSLFRTKR